MKKCLRIFQWFSCVFLVSLCGQWCPAHTETAEDIAQNSSASFLPKDTSHHVEPGFTIDVAAAAGDSAKADNPFPDPVSDRSFKRRSPLLKPTEEAVRIFMKQSVLAKRPVVQTHERDADTASLPEDSNPSENVPADIALTDTPEEQTLSSESDSGQPSDSPKILSPVVDFLSESQAESPPMDAAVWNMSHSSEASVAQDAALPDVVQSEHKPMGNDKDPPILRVPEVDVSSSDAVPAVVTVGEEDGGESRPHATMLEDLDPTQSLLESGGPTATDDMPSFNEWTKKRLEEQGQQLPQHATGQQPKVPVAVKKRHKNYASVDCGAKVLATNPEAQSSSAVLSHDQDDYMLNPCTAKIWLVVELCESIQVDRLELANYELFSSSPRQFSVLSSDRYPTRDWNLLGAFEAQDEKSVQVFPLHQTAFSKYIKVEMFSHYGAEHFCPLSLIRVYGTSEYEALETEEQAPDDSCAHVAPSDDEDPALVSNREPTDLFGSAKDAVITIMKKAAEVLTPAEKSLKPGGGDQRLDGTDDFDRGGCRCLQRLPNVDCHGFEHTARSEQNRSLVEMSLSFLQCKYDMLTTLLQRIWPTTSEQRFSDACAEQCSPFLGAAVDVRNYSRKCAFYNAALGLRCFGALCHLDKLLVDQLNGVPVEDPYCPFVVAPSSATIVPSFDVSESSTTPVSHPEGAAAASSHAPVNVEGVPDLVTSLPPSFLGSGSTSMPLLVMGTVLDGYHGAPVVMTEKPISIVGGSDAAVSQGNIQPTRTFQLDEKVAAPRVVVETVSDDAAALGSERLAHDATSLSLVLGSKDASFSAVAGSSKVVTGPVSVALEAFSDNDSSKPEKLTADGDVPGPGAPLRSSTAAVDVASLESFESGGMAGEANRASVTSPLQSDAGSEGIDLDRFVEEEGSSAPPLTTTQPEFTLPVNTTTGKPVALHGGFVGVPLAPGQKESVFVRLSNRIKALELNMSLSGQYLEELSRRYRKQMEEMQRAFNKTISALNETARKAHEQDLRQQEMISMLQVQLDSLSKVVTQMAEQQESLNSNIVARHLILMMVEALVMTALLLACSRPGHPSDARQTLRSAAIEQVSPERVACRRGQNSGGGTTTMVMRAIADSRPPQRHNSDPNLTALSPNISLSERRRPSTEALNVSGSYSDLLIVEPTVPMWMERRSSSQKDLDPSRKAKRKKQKNKAKGNENDLGLYRSLSNSSLPSSSSSSSKPPVYPRPAPTRKGSSTSSEVNSAGLLFAASSSGVENLLPPAADGHRRSGRRNADAGCRRRRSDAKVGSSSSGSRSREDGETCGTDIRQRSSPPPPPVKRQRGDGKPHCYSNSSSTVNGSVAACPTDMFLTYCRPFSFKEANLDASSVHYSGCNPPVFTGKDSREEGHGYENVSPKVC